MESSKKYELTGPRGAEEFRNLPEGLKLELLDGAIGEIVGNPHDGAFVLLKILAYPDDPPRVGAEEVVFYTEIKGVVLSMPEKPNDD